MHALIFQDVGDRKRVGTKVLVEYRFLVRVPQVLGVFGPRVRMNRQVRMTNGLQQAEKHIPVRISGKEEIGRQGGESWN